MNYSIAFELNGQLHELECKKTISLENVKTISEGIAECVMHDGNYAPYNFDFYYWGFILKYFTNIDLESFGTEELWDIMCADEGRLIANLKDATSEFQRQLIRNSAQELIDVKLNEHPFTPIAAKLNKFFEDVQSALKVLVSDESARKNIFDVLSSGDLSNIQNLIDMFNEPTEEK